MEGKGGGEVCILQKEIKAAKLGPYRDTALKASILVSILAKYLIFFYKT